MRISPEDEQDAQVDDLVRTVLAPRRHAADRIVKEALRSKAAGTVGSTGRRRLVSLRGVLAIAAAVLLVAVVLSAPSWRGREPQSPRGALSNEGPVTILSMPGGPITILGPDGNPSPVPAGTSHVELLGEPR